MIQGPGPLGLGQHKVLATRPQPPLPPPVRTAKSPKGWGSNAEALVSLGRCDGPFEGAETDGPFLAYVGLGLGAGTLSPGRDQGRGPPLCCLGHCAGQPVHWLGGRRQWGAAASGAGIAGWQGSGTFLYLRPRERNLIRRGEPGRSTGWGRPFGLQAAVCVHSNLRASTGGFPII